MYSLFRSRSTRGPANASVCTVPDSPITRAPSTTSNG